MKVQKLLNGIYNLTKATKMVSNSRDRIREVVRHYYNNTCQLCGRVWKQGERRFDIHHKDCKKEKTKQIDRDEDIENLTCLCHKCHLQLPEHRQQMSKSHKCNSG